MSHTNVITIPRLHEKDETAKLICGTRRLVYRLWQRGELGYVYVGNKKVCTDEHILHYLKSREFPARAVGTVDSLKAA